MRINNIKSEWGMQALIGRKEESRGRYLTELFVRAADRGLSYLPENDKKLNLLKTDLWNEGVDFEKNVLGNYIGKNLNLFGIDISGEVIKAVKIKGINCIQADIKALPFSDSSFDLILDLSTIDHVPYEAAKIVLNEYRRILKSNSVLVLVFDAWGFFWKSYFYYLKIFKKQKISVFENSEIKNQYIFSPNKMLGTVKLLGFNVLEEYCIDWFGWTWNRLTVGFWEKIQKTGYKKLVDMEYSAASKFFKPLAKQYVIIMKINK